MIKSELYKGKIFSGETQLNSSIVVKQTGAMQLTVMAGSFTTTGNKRLGISPQTYTLKSDINVGLSADLTEVKHYRLELGLDNGVFTVLAQARFQPDNWQQYPAGWQTIQPLVFEFTVPPNTVSLDAIDIYVLTVEPGFPIGTTAAGWQVQNG